MAKKYYAVKVGLTPGIYKTWPECQANVMGYPNAKYKGFDSLEEAEAFVNGDMKKKADREEISGPIAYVDGSFDVTTNRYAYGVAILFDGKEYHLSGFGNDEEMATMRNVAGEIMGATAAMKYALTKNWKEITIFHDYNGISEWCTGGWKTNKDGTKEYKETYLRIKKDVDVKFVKVKGHSNDFYNDVVDGLAKLALGIESGIKKSTQEHIKKIREGQ